MFHSHITSILIPPIQEINFTMLDTAGQGANGRGLLRAVESVLSGVFIPALKNLKSWEQLSNQSADGIRSEFLNSLDSFVSVLVGMLLILCSMTLLLILDLKEPFLYFFYYMCFMAFKSILLEQYVQCPRCMSATHTNFLL